MRIATREENTMLLAVGTALLLENIGLSLFGEKQRSMQPVVEGVIRVADRPAAPNPRWSSEHPDPASSFAPYRVYNIGNNQPVELMRLIEVLEQALGRTAVKNMLPMQPGDVPATYADVDDLTADVGFRPSTPIEDGVSRFVRWYREYHKC